MIAAKLILVFALMHSQPVPAICECRVSWQFVGETTIHEEETARACTTEIYECYLGEDCPRLRIWDVRGKVYKAGPFYYHGELLKRPPEIDWFTCTPWFRPSIQRPIPEKLR